MNYELMHKNIVVAEIGIDPRNGTFQSLGSIYNDAHLPIPVTNNRLNNMGAGLGAWWGDRAIPRSRQGSKYILGFDGVSTFTWLQMKSFALNLSDQYWIRPVGSNLDWEKENFFINDFSDDVGKLLFGHKKPISDLNLNSPDSASNGNLRKRWVIENNKRVLIKGGSGTEQQETINEVVADFILGKLNINHIPYSFYIEEKKGLPLAFSKCETMVTQNTELIPAWQILVADQSQKTNYDFYINRVKELGIVDIVKKMEEMLCIDFILGNIDRHQNNFGLIRDANTLEFLDMAPIYDNGMSMCFMTPTNYINIDTDIDSRPFYDYHNEQIKLVKNTMLDFSKLENIDTEIYDIMSKSPLLDEERKAKLIGVLNYRINNLEQILDKQVVKTYNTEQIVDPKAPANLPDVIVGYKIVKTTSILEDKVYAALMTDLYGSANPYIAGKLVYKNGKYYAINRQSFPDMDKARTAYEKLIETLQYEIEHPEEMQQQIAPVVNNLEQEDELEL